MAISEVTDMDTSNRDSSESRGAGDSSADKRAGSKKNIYRIAAVLGVIAVSLYALSILSLVYSRGVVG